MKVILSKNEFGRLCDMNVNIFDSIKEIDSDCADLDCPNLIDSLKEVESSIISINVLPSGDIEIEYSEEFCMDTYELMEGVTIKALPILYRLAPVVEKVMDTVETIVGLFDSKVVDSIKNLYTDVVTRFESLSDKYME